MLLAPMKKRMLFKLIFIMSNFPIRVTILSLSRTTSFTRRTTISSLLTFVLLLPPDGSLLVGDWLGCYCFEERDWFG